MKSLEEVVRSCERTGDFLPAWQAFANAPLYIPVLRNDSGAQTQDFRFCVSTNPQDGKHYVVVSDVLENLSTSQSEEAIREVGGKFISMLNPELGVIIALSSGAFVMPSDLVTWLRSSFQLTAP